MSRGGWALIAVALATVAAFLSWATATAWSIGGDEPISLHGWIAMGLGVVLSGALAGGLMWLAFHSSRRGWDDIDREP